MAVTALAARDRRSETFTNAAHRKAAKLRIRLAVCTVMACTVVMAAGGPSTTAALDPDLTRLVRFMAALKGGFALVALAACAWRLGRPATPWREAVYAIGPGAMAAGALALWQGQALGLATVGLHAGMFALLAAGLSDEAFIPARRRATR